MADGLAKLDAIAQAELVARGEITPLELVDAAIQRIQKLNPQLNAVITPLFEKARRQAKAPDLPVGPFRGVPFLVKDVVCHTAGDPYHCGMRFLRDLGWREAEDTTLAQRFRAAGFVIVGKSNTPELAFSVTTEPLAYGPTRNPWDTSRTPSGSSGGAAAAVASGMVPVAHGNDMGGSIRTPASACGLVGLKPTRARATLGPNLGEFWWQLTHEHVLTRSVRDTAGVLDCTSGAEPGDPYSAPPPVRPFLEEVGRPPGRTRIGFRTRLVGEEGEPHPECQAAVHGAARLLESLGHSVEEASPPLLDQETAFEESGLVVVVSIARELDRWSARTGRTIQKSDVEPTTWFAAELGRSVTATEFVEATERLHQANRDLASWWEEGFDLLVTPMVGEPTPPLGPLGPEGGEPIEVISRWGKFSPFAILFNVSGQPAMSLPLHWDEAGLPIGVQLVAAYGREDLLIRVASQLEEAAPWRDRHPPLHCE
jgi:amidase